MFFLETTKSELEIPVFTKDEVWTRTFHFCTCSIEIKFTVFPLSGRTFLWDLGERLKSGEGVVTNFWIEKMSEITGENSLF